MGQVAVLQVPPRYMYSDFRRLLASGLFKKYGQEVCC